MGCFYIGTSFVYDEEIKVYSSRSISQFFPGNSHKQQDKTVPQTDTGKLVEYTKARERTKFKELGEMTS